MKTIISILTLITVFTFTSCASKKEEKTDNKAVCKTVCE